MASNKLGVVSICIVIIAVTFSMALNGSGDRSTISSRDNVTKPNVSATVPVTRSTMAVTDPVTRSTMAVTEPVTRSTMAVTEPVTRSVMAATASLTDAPDRTSTVSPTDAPDRTSTVSLTDAPDRTSTVSPTDAPDRTSTVSLTDAPDRTSTVSPTDAANRTSTVSPTDTPDRTSTVSPTDAPDRTSTVSPTDFRDRTSTVFPTDVPDGTSTVSPTEGNPTALLVSNPVPFTTDYVRRTFLPETTPKEWWVNTPSTTPLYQTTVGGNSLDRFLGIHDHHGNPCPFGQVYYYGSCHVTWQNTTPRPFTSTQEYMSAPHTAGTSIQPRFTTKPHVEPPPTTRTYVQPLTTGVVDEDLSHEPSAVTASTNTSPDHVLKTADTQSTTSRLQCNHITLNNSTFNIYPNGSVVLKSGRVINENDFILTPKGQLKVCVTALGSQGSNTKFKIDLNRPTVVLTNICLVSSQVFLLLTFIFHCFFSSLRNLPGVILMFLSASLFLAHATFFFGSAQAYNRTACIAIGVVIHFFWLASFCWLNISSFHTFRVFKDVFASRSFESNKMTIILKYCIFGYGTPAVVIAATITANYFVSGSESFGYADTSNFCFVSNGTNSIVGLLVPAGVTILVSFTLFILTVVYLCRASANRRQVGNGDKWNILMYIKLSSITGFSWVFGFLQMVDRSSQVFTYLFICLTGAQGVFIFLAFMANKRTFLLVKHVCRKQSKGGKYSTTSSDTKPVPSDVEDANKV
ncbi:cell wall protein DAN4-like [Haliotis rubra]|uniref:cell wall protein DAN4-like n=1 Tax=Haliotis rubra TaxID=36100 RepID=UPI001EE5FE39|nr:cell wall protein DAN4-like [Haliotis rubra]